VLALGHRVLRAASVSDAKATTRDDAESALVFDGFVVFE
jgi:hypothetical protein